MSRDLNLCQFIAAGFITAGWPTRATDAGLAALGDFEPLPTGSELAQYWLARLTGGEQEILRVLLEADARGMTREEIDAACGFKRSSRDTYLQRLGARKLIEKREGLIFASEMLFG